MRSSPFLRLLESIYVQIHVLIQQISRFLQSPIKHRLIMQNLVLNVFLVYDLLIVSNELLLIIL